MSGPIATQYTVMGNLIGHISLLDGEIGILAYKAEALARQNEAGGPDALTVVSEAKAGQGSGNYEAFARPKKPSTAPNPANITQLW